jgi:GNAT superfamily N-acetyltransferase
MEIALRPPSPEEIALLAEMNHALIRDEASRNPMTLAQLEARMRDWVKSGYRAFLIEAEGEIAGYVLYQERRDEYSPDRAEIYLRQLYVVPDMRGRSIGSGAVELLFEEHFPPGARIVLDVLETNPRALQFWRRLGFAPYCTTLSLVRDK